MIKTGKILDLFTKEPSTFSVARKLVKRLADENISIERSPMIPGMRVGKKIIVGKGFKDTKPLSVLFHEYGHVLAEREHPSTIMDHPISTELRANDKARKLMQSFKMSPKQIEDFNNHQANPLRTYKSNLGTASALDHLLSNNEVKTNVLESLTHAILPRLSVSPESSAVIGSNRIVDKYLRNKVPSYTKAKQVSSTLNKDLFSKKAAINVIKKKKTLAQVFKTKEAPKDTLPYPDVDPDYNAYARQMGAQTEAQHYLDGNEGTEGWGGINGFE
jgi:hypothetical protein